LTAITAFFGAVSTRLTTCTQQATVTVNTVVTNPQNQIMATEAAAFVANLFYEGADDVLPTPGAGGELGKALRKLPKAFKVKLTDILKQANTIKIRKVMAVNINGSNDDCLKHFESLLETIPKNKIADVQTINAADGIRKTYILTDETKITYRTGVYTSTNVPTIQIDANIADNVKNGRKLEIKFSEQ